MMQRVLGLGGAVLLGLGSILGTGVFVSLAIAGETAGAMVLLALVLAALLAIGNGLSSAALAAKHPVSGGTYEYGYRELNPTLGFAAGWLFLCAKSASFASAALGAGAYAAALFGIQEPLAPRLIAVASVLVVSALSATGVKRGNAANAALVSVTILGLVLFAILGWSRAATNGVALTFEGAIAWPKVWEATALIFVAYTGYGRIATLGEEVKDPARTVPRAVVVTLVVTLALYLAVALGALLPLGGEAFRDARAHGAAAPLSDMAKTMQSPVIASLLAVASVTAMLGVQLNLSLGLSRVALAMGRRKDLPAALAKLSPAHATPAVASWVIGGVVALLAGTLELRASWSFSAFTVLVYYALTNLAAWRMRRNVLSAFGLIACLGLAPWVDPQAALAGLVLIGAGFGARAAAQKLAS